MREVTEISELNKGLSDLPRVIRYKDGDEIVDCYLTFYFHKDREHKWTAAYYCAELDYFLLCGFGDTIVAEVNHLRRVLKDYRKYKGEGYVRQY